MDRMGQPEAAEACSQQMGSVSEVCMSGGCRCLGCREQEGEFSSPEPPRNMHQSPTARLSGISSDGFMENLRGLSSDHLPGRRVVLNVGGKLFETSTDTILKDRKSYFATLLVKQHLKEGQPYWIDRDGSRFKYVLNYLRNGTICCNDIATLEAVAEEAHYYQLEQLQMLCDDKIREVLQREDEEKKDFIDCCTKSMISALVSNTGQHGDINLAMRVWRSPGDPADRLSSPVFTTSEDF